ncbi:MAG: hypothetical protein AB1483_02760 [Candidatus Zixiibacteriota bacterium]
MMKQFLGYLRPTVLFGILVVALYSPPVSAYTTEKGTITLKDSTVYENVSYTVDRRLKTISFKFENKKKVVSFTDVTVIVDSNGEDVTESVVGDHYRQRGGETWKSADSDVHREARRKLYKIGFSWGGNYCFPLGDYYEGFQSGFGFDGNIIVPFTHNTAFRASISYAGIRPEDGLAYLVTDNYVDFYLLDDYNISTWKYSLSAQFYGAFNRDEPSVLYYVYGGFGGVTSKLEADQTYLASNPLYNLTTRIESTETKFITTMGAGLDFLIDQDLGFNLGACLDILWLGNGDQSDVYYVYDEMNLAYHFDIQFGMVLLLK